MPRIQAIREEFDEETEPDGMVLSGWTPAAPTEKAAHAISNGEGTSSAPPGTSEAEIVDDVEIVPAQTDIPVGTKRKLTEILNSKDGESDDVRQGKRAIEVDDNGDDDDVVLMLEENPEKKKRLQ
ncbi:SUMO-activating enzyme subunit 2 [Acorus gramineus]|uniref:SUMO-activating enzyme subunit 2 n=1 Tax=Acorus gramineus TaxID=55184 RepID=A0AAV9B489_ACOGR|nr:SUMO-activating enzyme subunit 2 [Acorus gramineus]